MLTQYINWYLLVSEIDLSAFEMIDLNMHIINGIAINNWQNMLLDIKYSQPIQ